MPRNLTDGRRDLLSFTARSQHRARVFHQARHRPDRCDADVRGRIAQQPCAVGAVSVDARAELRQCVERGAAHAGNVVVQHRSETLRGARVAEGTECPNGGEPAGVPAIPECLHRDLDGPTISNPPQGAGHVCNQRASTSKSRARSGPAARRPSRSTSRAIAARTTSGLGSSSDRTSSSGDRVPCTARSRWVASTRRISAILPRQLASAARIRSAVAASSSSAAGLARRKSMSFTPSIGTRWTCA